MRYHVDFEIDGLIRVGMDTIEYVSNLLLDILSSYSLQANIEYIGYTFLVDIIENKEWLRFKLNGHSIPNILTDNPYDDVEKVRVVYFSIPIEYNENC